MSDFIPKILIFGHSFVRSLQDDLVKGFDSPAKQNFNLAEELARFCRDMLKIKVVLVCQVINRNKPHSTAPDLAFNNMAAILRQYLRVVACYP